MICLFQSLGNHEFDNGVSGLSPFIENLTCPVLAANLELSKEPELGKQTNLKNSMTFEISGTKVGVIGYLTPETKFLAKENDVEYVDEIVALKEEVANLQNEGIKIIIALGHSGYLKDLQIAKEVEGVDLVIGGHSNTFLWNGTSPDAEEIQGPYPTYVKQASGRTALVVQAYAYTKYLGKLHMVFDSNGEIVSADGQPILLDNSIPQDQETLQIVNRYSKQLKNLTDNIVGETSVVLDGLGCQQKECNLGNLIADAMFYTYTESYKGDHWTDVPIAMIQGGGIRASIAHVDTSTKISKADLIAVLPFGGNLTIVTVNGSIILQMLEHSVASYDLLDPPGEFLHYSGLRVVYDLSKPVGNRVVSAKARCWTCDVPEYFDVEKSMTYKVLVPGFVAMGGDGYTMLVDLPSEVLPYNELSCTEFYIKHHSPVFPEVEGRTILLNTQLLRSSSVIVSPSLILISIIGLFKLHL